MKRLLFLMIVVGALGAGGYLAWAAKNGERPFRSRLVVACEEKLLSGLKSPSSYSLIEFKEWSFEISPADARDRAWRQMRDNGRALWDGAVKDLDRWMALGDESEPYREWMAVLTYDAANSYGALIRDKALCTFIGREVTPEALRFGIEFTG
tara:strand:+ start:500 stop:955 length:456 start_codon:yes stop_codon:yes gene_type:complete